jgi:ABC-2 type transport system ATP-binding protein
MVEGPRTPSVVAERLSKRFGPRVAVHDVSFRFEEPMIVGLVGPNGAGKTTLIRLMLGLATPSEGSVTVDGRPASRVFRRAGPTVGYMPQREAIYADLSVWANVMFFARIHRVPRELRAKRVQQAIELVALGDRTHDRVTSLSGGMRRRVSLASALVHQPRLVVLDEPTVGVDPELRVEMWASFRRSRQRGSLIFLSTHYMGEADRCDVVVFMRYGRVLAADTPKRLMQRTRTKELEAAFLRFLEKEAAA